MSLASCLRSFAKPTSAVRSCTVVSKRHFSNESLKRTALYDEHVKLGGKMVPFAGYELPVQYKEGVVSSHLHVRKSAGLFDVSHMGQLTFRGNDVEKFLEHVLVADTAALEPHQSTLTLITNANGGIKDDCVMTKRGDHFRLVVNGACKDADIDHFESQLEKFPGVTMEHHTDRALMALQGPKAADVLLRHLPSSINMNSWAFMQDADVKLSGTDATVCRCGYTGEDGFEISVSNADAVDVWNKLLDSEEVNPTGLAVRDSLRLEAGLCLYGNDIDETTTPVEAGLVWTITPRRRESGGFIGFDVINEQRKNKSFVRKRVGLVVTGAPAREGAPILDADGNQIGSITSGTFSPVLKKALSMGYVHKKFQKAGTEVFVEVRGKKSKAVITKMPFVPSNYHRVQ